MELLPGDIKPDHQKENQQVAVPDFLEQAGIPIAAELRALINQIGQTEPNLEDIDQDPALELMRQYMGLLQDHEDQMIREGKSQTWGKLERLGVYILMAFMYKTTNRTTLLAGDVDELLEYHVPSILPHKQIEILDQLLGVGIITQEQYDAYKARHGSQTPEIAD